MDNTRNAQVVYADGIKFIISSNNIHVCNSIDITHPWYMKALLISVRNSLIAHCSKMDTPFNHRSIDSMVREWVTHNNLYKLGITKNRTGESDINYPQKWYISIAYFIGSLFVL